MSVPQTPVLIYYPESDGMPMGESDLHRYWMNRMVDILCYRYRGQRVYVSGNLIMYFEEGFPQKVVSPDAFVVLNCSPGMRRIYKTWEEGQAPHVVFEVTSKSTQQEDSVWKPEKYARMGVQELFLYDPTGDYLTPSLQGYRLEDGGLERIKPDAAGNLECRTLDIRLCLHDGQLAFYDRLTGQALPTESEAMQARAEAAEAQAAAESQARRALEAQLEQLRRLQK